MGTNTAQYKAVQSLSRRLSLTFQLSLSSTAAHLFEVDLINQATLAEVGNANQPVGDRSLALLTKVLIKIELNQKCYDVFLSVLKKVDGLTDIAAELDAALKAIESKTGYTAIQPEESYVAHGGMSPQGSSFPQTSPTQHSVPKHFKVASIDDSDLDVDDDLEDVLEAVKSLGSEWKTLLTRLHIKQDTLDVIDIDNPRDVGSCLRVGLSKWLKMNYNYPKYGRPSWRMLAKAVSTIDNRLFEKIAKDHPTK